MFSRFITLLRPAAFPTLCALGVIDLAAPDPRFVPGGLPTINIKLDFGEDGNQGRRVEPRKVKKIGREP
jgi:hypothetical protein